MGAVTLPSTCSQALKEWATVLEAMARGEQLVLIRKGGLIEPGSGFELVANTFVFYPTFEHHAVTYLREPYQRYFDQAVSRRAPEGHVRVELCGVATTSMQTADPAVIERLAPFHIYNPAFVHQRLKWQPEQPLAIVVVRVFQLAAPRLLPVAPHYAGCKSWVTLETSVALEGLRPVLDDATFHQRARTIAALLAPQ